VQLRADQPSEAWIFIWIIHNFRLPSPESRRICATTEEVVCNPRSRCPSIRSYSLCSFTSLLSNAIASTHFLTVSFSYVLLPFSVDPSKFLSYSNIIDMCFILLGFFLVRFTAKLKSPMTASLKMYALAVAVAAPFPLAIPPLLLHGAYSNASSVTFRIALMSGLPLSDPLFKSNAKRTYSVFSFYPDAGLQDEEKRCA
jgi:hypothetical protein